MEHLHILFHMVPPIGGSHVARSPTCRGAQSSVQSAPLRHKVRLSNSTLGAPPASEGTSTVVVSHWWLGGWNSKHLRSLPNHEGSCQDLSHTLFWSVYCGQTNATDLGGQGALALPNAREISATSMFGATPSGKYRAPIVSLAWTQFGKGTMAR